MILYSKQNKNYFRRILKMARRNRKNGKSIHIGDLSNVETSKKALPEGEYLVKVAEVEDKESSNGNPMLAFTFNVEEGDYKGSKLFHNCSLQPQALFNLKGILLALGYDIPSSDFDLDTTELIGLTCGVDVAHEVYNGKKRARITDFYNPDDEDSEEDEDGEEEIDLSELEMDDLKELATEVGISKVKLRKLKTEEKLINAITAEDGWEDAYDELFGEDEEEDNEDSEEDEDGEEDYESMSIKDLKAEARERGLKIKKGMDKDDIIDMIEEDDEE